MSIDDLAIPSENVNPGRPLRPILMAHAPNGIEHLASVREEMRHRGPPQLDVVDFGHTLVLPDGVHRTFAAYQLGLKPKFIRHLPSQPVRSAKRYSAELYRNAYDHEAVAVVGNKPWLYWLRIFFSFSQATIGEVGCGIGAVRTGRLHRLKSSLGVVHAAGTSAIYADLISPHWFAAVPPEVMAEKRAEAQRRFRPMEPGEFQQMFERAA